MNKNSALNYPSDPHHQKVRPGYAVTVLVAIACLLIGALHYLGAFNKQVPPTPAPSETTPATHTGK